MKKNKINESLTLKINEKVNALKSSGKRVYNLTSGQLNFRPPLGLIKSIEKELNFLQSFQYSPNSGFKELREKFLNDFKSKRNIQISKSQHGALITSGSKASLNLALGSILNSTKDEVIVIAPYWGTYVEAIKIWKGKVVKLEAHSFNLYIPCLDELSRAITSNTKAIIINSPNNPSGVHYGKEWMVKFAELLNKHEELLVISDEVYSDLSYFDPKPCYYYEYDQKLLDRTIVISGISKSLASSGLRVGYSIGSKKIIENMISLQSQLTSGPSSLIQSALINFDFDSSFEFLDSIKKSTRNCSQILRDSFVDNDLSHIWYQPNGGFYYFIDFSKFPFFTKYSSSEEDCSEDICEQILDQTGVALVPGNYFGVKNSARISFTLEESAFEEAVTILFEYLVNSQDKFTPII